MSNCAYKGKVSAKLTKAPINALADLKGTKFRSFNPATADAGDTVERYFAKVGKSKDQLAFPPDDDAIIPVLDGEWFDQERTDQLRHHVLLVMMPVFFLSTGLRTNWAVGGTEVFAAAALLLVASVAGKLIGVRIAARVLHWAPGEASIIGWLLQTKALIMIIFANILLDKHVITSNTFTALLLMAVASTMLTVPMVAPQLQKLRGLMSRVS